MISFENWEICQETKLLSEEFLKQLEDFKIVELESIKTGGQGNKGKKVIIKLNQNKAKKKLLICQISEEKISLRK